MRTSNRAVSHQANYDAIGLIFRLEREGAAAMGLVGMDLEFSGGLLQES